ncbi:MAG: permease [Ectothiorhodospiraceae bacterium]|nr:permease [Ectothiorhodospiraceae bacterium]
MREIAASGAGILRGLSFRLRGRPDSAVIALVVTVLVLLAVEPRQALDSLLFAARTILILSPYLVLAFALGAYAKASSADVLISRAAHGRPVVMIVSAAFLGAWSPLCSCAVVALVAVLLRSGMPLSAVMAFWIASPIMSPEMYVFTGALLGFEFATAKLVAAAFMGLLAGFAVLLVEHMGGLRNPLRPEVLERHISLNPDRRPNWTFWREPERRAAFRREFVQIAVLLVKWMFLAFVLQSILVRYVPAEQVGQWVGSANQWAVPLATVLGAPAYVNGTAAVPLVQGLMTMGMSSAAAMGFLLGGSVTSIPAMAAVFPVVRRTVFVTYLVLAMATALAAAGLFQLYLLLG